MNSDLLSHQNRSTAFVAVALIVGLMMRYALLDVTSLDKDVYHLPWYAFARDHGWGSLGERFTNYTPFYSYLLIPLTKLDGLADPWHLMKAMSLPFELGCAVLGAMLVGRAGGNRTAATFAFAAIWLAPIQMFNGAGWAQTDSMWACFLLLATLLASDRRELFAVIAFGVALSIKAQAIFWSPILLALILARRLPWTSVLIVPLVYAATCLPVWLAGRSIVDLLTIYGDQASTFRDLSRNAANIWAVTSNDYYVIGCLAGAAMALIAGLVLAIALTRSIEFGSRPIIFATTVALFVMPFLLPKMHERYFYGYEIMIIVLACLDRRLIGLAILAQITGAMAYVCSTEYNLQIIILTAAVLNSAAFYFLIKQSPNWLLGKSSTANGIIDPRLQSA